MPCHWLELTRQWLRKCPSLWRLSAVSPVFRLDWRVFWRKWSESCIESGARTLLNRLGKTWKAKSAANAQPRKQRQQQQQAKQILDNLVANLSLYQRLHSWAPIVSLRSISPWICRYVQWCIGLKNWRVWRQWTDELILIEYIPMFGVAQTRENCDVPKHWYYCASRIHEIWHCDSRRFCNGCTDARKVQRKRARRR